MASAFDNLTMGDVDDIVKECLDGKPFSHPDVDPMKLAGAVLWKSRQRNGDRESWDDFRYKTTMGEIKEFSMAMQAEEESVNPTQGAPIPN